MLVLLAALLASPSLAHDPKTVPSTAARDPLGIEIQASALHGASQPWITGQARLVGRKDAYVGVEGRVAPDQSWVGRIGAGFDILGRSEWDLKLGLFMGGMGYGFTREQGWVAGTEVSFKATIGRLYGQYRWLGGFGHTELAELHSEHDVTVGFRIFEELRVFGHFLWHQPSRHRQATAAGLGLAFRF